MLGLDRYATIAPWPSRRAASRATNQGAGAKRRRRVRARGEIAGRGTSTAQRRRSRACRPCSCGDGRGGVPATSAVGVGIGSRVAHYGLVVAANLAVLAWLSVAGLVFLAVAARDAPEGTTGLVVAVLMPDVLVPALFLTAVTALLYYEIRGGRFSLLIAVAATLAAPGPAYAWSLLLYGSPL